MKYGTFNGSHGTWYEFYNLIIVKRSSNISGIFVTYLQLNVTYKLNGYPPHATQNKHRTLQKNNIAEIEN